MPEEKLLIETAPSAEDVQFLEDQINQFNIQQTGIRDDQLLASFVRDEQGQIGAGIFGWTWGGCLEVKDLWVREDWRGHGYGRQLLAAAEEEAERRGCHQALLDTHSFQAANFYQKYGYEIFGVLDDYPVGYKKYYLRKSLGRTAE